MSEPRTSRPAPAPVPATSEEMSALARVVAREAGLRVDLEVAERLRWRLGPLLRSLGLSSVRSLVRHLQGGRREVALAPLAEAVANGETSFFRGAATWRMLGERLLPELVERTRGERALRAWSAGCSTGQEPYSLAMLARERLGDERLPRRVEILATDLCEAALERARGGSFTSSEVARGLSPERLRRHFRVRGGGWEIRPEVRALVRFRRLNLARPWPFLAPFDLMLLRHVLVHLTEPARAAVLRGARRALRPGGYLILGVGETAGEGFEQVPADPSGAAFRPTGAPARSARPLSAF